MYARQNLNYQVADGRWAPIDLSLRQVDGGFQPSAAPTDLTLPAAASDGTVATLKGDDGTVSLRLPNPVVGTAAGGAMKFAGGAGQPSVFVQPTDTGFEFGATLADAATASRIDYVLDPGTLQPSIAKNGYSIDLGTTNPSGGTTLVGSISAPSVLDASHREADLQYVSVSLLAQLDGTYLLSYTIDPTWLAAKDRAFPVTLDPTVCIRNGYTGCAYTTASDIWYGQGDSGHASYASTWVDSSTTQYLHVGWYLGTGNPWGQTRSALYFPGATLPDGAVITSANLSLRELNNYSGGTTAKIYARLIDKPTGWTIDTSSASWNSLQGAVNGAYDSPQYSPCDNGGTDCTLDLDVTKIARAWYTRRGTDWKPNGGIQVRYATEGTAQAYWDTSFYGARWSSIGARPLLSITYEQPGYDIDFDPALGSTYAPSTLLAGTVAKLPVQITNNSALTFATTDTKLAYRFLDTKGALVGSVVISSLPAAINPGVTSSTFALSVTAPSAPGAYTLKVELVRVVSGTNLFATDWAQPTLYYSRDKRVLTNDSTRWTGSSMIDRDEFTLRVISGQGAAGDVQSVTSGDGAHMGINLWSHNLGYAADTGLGFSDRSQLGLTYGYNSIDAAACAPTTSYLGVLRACGWFTSADERVTAGSNTGDFTYYDTAGNAYLVDTDSDGQLIGAPSQLYRVRATLFDENRPTSGGSFVSAASQGIPTYGGTPNVVSVSSQSTIILAGTSAGGDISLTTYRMLNWGMRTTGATSSALCAEIYNKTANTTKWFCYTTGPNWTTGQVQTAAGMTINGNWASYSQDLWGQVSNNVAFGASSDDYYVKRLQIMTAPGSPAGSTFIDGVRLEPKTSTWIADSVPAGITGAPTTTTDHVAGSLALKSTASASCSATGSCFPVTDISAMPFARWWWRKAGGTAAVMVFAFKDHRTNATGFISYYAGPTAPTGASYPNPVQVSPTVPGEWTRVTRNILEDARQILGFYYDSPTGSSSTTPPTQGPTPDSVDLTGYQITPVDGASLTVDQLTTGAAPDVTDLDRFAQLDEATHPTGSGDSWPTYDFKVENIDGSTHYFNRDGLLLRFTDSSGNAVNLDWTYGSLTGQTNYTLTDIRAATDGTTSGSWTYNRQIDVTSGGDANFSQLTFTEALGTTGAGIAGRRVDFYVAKVPGATWAQYDLVKVNPARRNGTSCGTSPSGCTEFEYTSTTSHLLFRAADPRWDGTSGTATDARLEVTRSGTDPMAILDRSHSSAPLLKVLSFDRGTGSSPLYQRPLYQDAAAGAAGNAIHEDLTPEGAVLRTYVRQACTSGDCSTSGNWPSGTDATVGPLVATSHNFDGLAHVSSTATYRCPATAVGGCTGTTALATVTRQGTNAGAKVDNFVDALSAAEVAWTQTADQAFASLRDSSGSNRDLYRTEYIYNGLHRAVASRSPTFARTADYAGAVLSSEWETSYWRLGEASGAFANSVGGGPSATGISVTYGQPGAIARNANTAVGFNGTSSKITSSATINGTGYTIEAWVNAAVQGEVAKGIAGRYLNNSGARLFLDANGHFAIQHQATIISSNIAPAAGRWYQVAGTWDGTAAALYVDGDLVAAGPAPGNTGTGSSNFEIGTNSNGFSGAFFQGSIDEVSLRSRAIDQSWIRKHYSAGRGFAWIQRESTFDLAGRQTQADTQIALNGDIEEGLASWDATHGTLLETSIVHGGSGSIKLVPFASAGQDPVLVPGQRFHLQFWGRTDGTAGSGLTYEVYYWRVSDQSWQTFSGGPMQINNTTTWTAAAYQYTVPATDTTGLIRLAYWNGPNVGAAYIDDVLLTTGWSATAFLTTGVTAGLPDTTTTLSHTGTSTIVTKFGYTADATHPGIFPTSVIANHVDGSPGPGTDTDVTTSATFDTWGHLVTMTDPDLVVQQTAYAANHTDVASTTDGLGNTTVMTYDAVGNRLTTTTPLGRVTNATYDPRNQLRTTTAPDGVVARVDYDNYGRATASWSNYTTGTPGADHDVLTTYAYDAYGQIVQQDVECGSVGACATSGLDARTATSYDLLGNVVTRTTYPGAGGTGTARVTTNYFETYPSASPVYSATKPSGSLLPVAPTAAPAPLCPGSTTVRCNTAAVWLFNGATVSGVDMNGHAYASTDAYGIVTVTDVDFAGKPVSAIAAYVAGGASTADKNVITRVEYNVAGDVLLRTDALGRSEARTYDALGRTLSVAHRDTAGSSFLTETTAYLPSGRVDLSYDGAAYSKTRYDGAGRAIQTIANYDASGKAAMTIDALESGIGAWNLGSSGFFTTAAAGAIVSDADAVGNIYDPIAAVSGRGRLHVTTHATNSNNGAWIDLSGPTYQSGHTYKASFDMVASSAGLSLTAYLGQDASGGSYGSLGITSTLAWGRYTVSWTAGTSLTTPIRFAIRKAAAGTAQLYLDNLVVWDSTTPDSGIVSTLTVYDADGETTASVLPPGDPTTERPLVTTVAFDPAGRTVASTTNGASGFYASVIAPTSGLVAYYPLDERLGTSAADRKPGGGTTLTIPTSLTIGVAGAIDEARTTVRFTGTNGTLTRSSNVTTATTNVSLEAWIRADVAPASTAVVASNGTAANGWGVAVDSAGRAAGFAISGSTLTTMPSTKVVADGAWHHLVLSRGASVWTMTVDAIAQALTNNTTNPGTPGAGFSLGALSDGTSPYAGEVDEVGVYTADISGLASAHWAAGRPTDAVTALTTRNTYDRLGRLTDAWAPDLVRTKSVYDRLGNQVETWANYRDGTTAGGSADDDVKSTFAYDVLGELVGYCPAVQVASVGSCAPGTSSEPKAWHYGFDLLGRQTTTVAPDNTAVVDLTTEEVAYELGGRVAKTCRYPAGGSCGTFSSRHVDFTYDDLGRILTQKTWDRGVSPAADTLKFTKTMTWLADDSPSTVNEGSDTLTYTYDTAGRTSQLKRGATVLTAYTYTPGTSTIATRTDGTQGATAFTYDWARRQTVIDPPDTFVAGTVSRTYRLDGLLATQGFPSSITEALAYDVVKRPISIGLGTPGSLSQTFDRAGRVTSDGRSLTGISGDAGTGTQTFTYDGLSRLTGSSLASAARTYQYDLDGNRTRRAEGGVTTDFIYDRAGQVQQQVIGVTTKTFDYDRYGNLLKGADVASAFTTYAFDEANRLTSITPPTGGAVTFTLDAVDRHATRLVGGVLADTYAYMEASETAWQSGTGATTTTTSLLDADGSRLAVKTNGAVAWLVFDLHGSVIAMCPALGSTITDAYRFDGFGQQIQRLGTSANPWRFRGLLNIGADVTSGALLDMGARDYSPQLGTFTQQDSVQGSAANPMTMNRFLYALADPATLIDPDGHNACLDVGTSCNPSGPTTGSFNTQISTNQQAARRARSTSPTNHADDYLNDPEPVNPWMLAQDPLWADVRSKLFSDCQGFIIPNFDACAQRDQLLGIEAENKRQYCAIHAAECKDLQAADDQATLLLFAMGVEVAGTAALIVLTPGIPDEAIPGTALAATTGTRASALQRLAAFAGEHGLFTKTGRVPGIRFLGHWPDYATEAAAAGKTYYQMPGLIGRLLGRNEGLKQLRWAFNEGFLRAGVRRRDVFELLGKPQWEGSFSHELEYLLNNGYKPDLSNPLIYRWAGS